MFYKEAIVVIIFISGLVLLTTHLTEVNKQVNKQEVKQNIKVVKMIIEDYKKEKNRYPSSIEELRAYKELPDNPIKKGRAADWEYQLLNGKPLIKANGINIEEE